MRLDAQLPDRGRGAPVRPGGSSWPAALAALLLVVASAGIFLAVQIQRASVAEQARAAEQARVIEQAKVAERTTFLERARVIKRAGFAERAKATGSPATWVTPDDYPAEALRNDEQGVVGVAYIVDRSGRVSDCIVAQSSGSEMLDSKTCALVKARARYVPARDAAGRPVEWIARLRFRWQIQD